MGCVKKTKNMNMAEANAQSIEEKIGTHPKYCLTFFIFSLEAVRKLVPRLDPERCRVCRVRIFNECAQMPGACGEADGAYC